MKRALLLDARDNCVVVLDDVIAGDGVRYEGGELSARSSVSLGHKLARIAIKAGDKVFKYGAIIGTAKQEIAAGEHIHTHNLGSDYIAMSAQQVIVANQQGEKP